MDLRSRFHKTSPRVMCGLLTGFEQHNQRRNITVRNRTYEGVTVSRRTGKERLIEITRLRVLDCFPSGAYALHALLQQLEISTVRSTIRCSAAVGEGPEGMPITTWYSADK